MIEDGDIQLVERGRRGDRDALEQLVTRYQGPVYNAVFRIVGNRDDAADLTQVAFLKVFENLDGFKPQFRFFSWLYRIAVNEALNFVRANVRMQHDGAMDDRPAEGGDPAQAAFQDEIGDQVQAAMMKLQAEDRAILTLRHFSERSYRDIAGILDIEEKTVKSRLYTARQRLRDVLEPWHSER